MKKCTWCGKEYPDTAERCLIDAEPLIDGEPPPAPAEKSTEPEQPISPTQFLDLEQVPGAFDFREGFSRPNWKIIAEAIKQSVTSEDRAKAWTDATLQWVERLRSNLGGEYRVRRSAEFILLSMLDSDASSSLLIFAEKSLRHIYESLQDAAWQWKHGKHVVLLFAEEDDYFQYLADYYADGIHPASGACLLHRGYVHIPMSFRDGKHIRRMLVHELAHNSVVHLQLPLWLNEGLAMLFEWTAIEWTQPILDGDLQERHLAFWNSENIQRFWAGDSFHEAGESVELSYNLAQILTELLNPRSKGFLAFVKTAHRDDGGQSAALDCLDTDLGQTVATFLGEGAWRPNRKAIADCWNAARAAHARKAVGAT
jgi:hypothetical protein